MSLLFFALPITGIATTIIDIILAILLFAIVIYFCFRFKLSNKVIISVSIACALVLLSEIFDFKALRGATIITLCLLTVYASLLLSNSEKEIEIRKNKKVSKKEASLTENESDELIENLHKAVIFLSSTQTGALITLERSDDLSVYMQKSGTKISAPVTPELLETIFYKGTPLHDGATIIRGNMIVSSAVFYQPTQKPLNGKYGSRHRAAIGFSEVCDALTIVISEETGKVSFAYKGELTTIAVGQFVEKFKEFYYNN